MDKLYRSVNVLLSYERWRVALIYNYSCDPSALAPVAETRFSPRLTPYKIVGHLFGRSYIRFVPE